MKAKLGNKKAQEELKKTYTAYKYSKKGVKKQCLIIQPSDYPLSTRRIRRMA